MIDHGRAIDLAATAMDFPLSPRDRMSLETHLSSCSACRTEAAAMRQDGERLRALPPVAPPAWVGRSIGRRDRPVALVLGFVLLVLSGSLAAVLAGSTQRQPSPVEITPTPGPSGMLGTYPSLLLNTPIRVTAPEVVLRQVPSTAGVEIARAAHDSVLATDGALRVRADGYEWYHAMVVSTTPAPAPLPAGLRDNPGPSGWIAVRSATEDFVTPVNPRCPSRVAIEEVAAMLEAERLACFGGATIQLDGIFTCPACGDPVSAVYQPEWLAAWNSAALVPGVGAPTGIALHFSPGGVAIPAEGSTISVRLHLDDAAAETCHLSLPMPGDPGASISPVDTESVVLLCRQSFVVESYEVTGSP
jgi:hypothetical protein